MSIKNLDAIPWEQEKNDIRAVQEYIIINQPVGIDELVAESLGETSDDELRMVGLTREKQVREIVSGLSDVAGVNYVSDAYITSDKDDVSSIDADELVYAESDTTGDTA